MQKILRIGATVACLASLAAGCGRRSGPTAPSSTQGQIPSVQVISIGGDGAGTTLTVGQSRQLKALARLSDGSEYDITPLAAWTAEDPRVASVTPMGMVTAAAAGTGRIRAAYQQATGVTTFDVAGVASGPDGRSPDSGSTPSNSGGTLPPPPGSPSPAPGPGVPSAPQPGLPPTVQSLTITGTDTVPVGRSAQMRAIANMSDGSQRDVTSSADWSSDNSLVGLVSQSGLLTGVTPGSNVVNARYGGASASQPVQVTPL